MKLLPTWISLPALVAFYRPLVRLSPNINKDGYVRRVVAVANSYFNKKFARIPFGDRMLFLPYCLRAQHCPTQIDHEEGLQCPADCNIVCNLKEMKETALALGYRNVYIVVSGKLHRKQGILRSRDFLVGKIKQHRPAGVIGCLCSGDLRRKYLSPKNLSPNGTLGKHGLSVIPQVALLLNNNCRKQSEVNWEHLRSLIKTRL